MSAHESNDVAPCVLALGVPADARAMLDAAIAALGVRLAVAADEADALARAHDAGVAVAGTGDDPSDVAARMLRIAQASTPPLPVVLIATAPTRAETAMRLASEGIDVVQARSDTLAPRLALHLHARRVACAAHAHDQRADALLRVHESLVAGLVHDLRTPLMAINLSAEVAAARSAEEPVRQAMRRIRSSTARMARALDHLVNLARLDTHRPPIASADGNLGALVDAVVAEVRAAQPGVAIDVAAQGQLGARFDAATLAPAIRHLVETTARYAQGASVGVRVESASRDRLWVEVSSAAVVPPEAQAALAGPPRERAGREQPGLALGLHAIDAAVRAHGGSVVGRSKAPDGTVFELLLPRDPGAR
jgi:signal transduction histidine kinase